APAGGLTPTVGNNPIAIGIPAGVEPPILVDVAMSVVAGGKVDLAAAEGQDLPEGWWLDAEGRPTPDPSAAPAGPGGPPHAPGAEGWRRRARALREGIQLPGSVYAALVSCAAERGIEVEIASSGR